MGGSGEKAQRQIGDYSILCCVLCNLHFELAYFREDSILSLSLGLAKRGACLKPGAIPIAGFRFTHDVD